MPQTMRRLADHKPLTVVAYGDSITAWNQCLGLPWRPALYADLGRTCSPGSLRSGRVGRDVTLYNAALGGMTSEWGKDNAASAVASLDPDLVLVGFGMNDFWSLSEADFRSNIAAIIDRVKAKNHKAEFVLISSIHFDPAYTKDPTYVGHFNSYIDALRSMTGPGVQLLDMAGISEALFKSKKAKDLLADPMHPDDFLARWYAQGLVAMFDRPASRRFYLAASGNDRNDGTSMAKAWRSLSKIGTMPAFDPEDRVMLESGAEVPRLDRFGECGGNA